MLTRCTLKEGDNMKDSTVLRLAELGVGFGLVVVHALTGVDNLIILIAALLFGVPIQILWERKKKEE